MKTKQLIWPSIEEQKQYWIDREAAANNATPDRMAEALRQFNLSPHSSSVRREANEALKAWDNRLRLSHGEQSTTADSKPKTDDLSRTEATCDYLDEEDRKWSLRDEGRSDGQGESYSERNR